MRRRSQLASTDNVNTGLNPSPVPPDGQNHGTTEGTPLDQAALELLRSMFLLLDEWDRAMQEPAHFSGECDITIDLKSP